MNPSIPDRLASMITAMNMAVIPAIDPAAPLAREQAGLIVGHLHVILAQSDGAERFEALELRAAELLAERLVGAAADDPRAAAVAMLLKGPASADDGSRLDGPARRKRIEAINAAVEELFDGPDAGTHFAGRARIILAFGQVMATANRSLFALTRFDPEAASLPEIPEALDVLAAELDRLALQFPV